jgi:hypothetical protein
LRIMNLNLLDILYTSKRDDVKWFMDAQFSPSGDLSSMCGSH